MTKGRKPGTPKTGGRRKGSQNRITASLKAAISDFLNQNWDSISTDWQSLEPLQRLAFYERLIKYVLPPASDELSRLTTEELEALINKLKNDYKHEKKS